MDAFCGASAYGAAHVAAREGKEKTLQLLFELDPNSLRRPAADGRCPAHWAALSGQAGVLDLLQGLAPDTLRARALNGATPAHDAAAQGQTTILQLLHELAPSTLSAKSKIGARPAHDAAFAGHVDTLMLLKHLVPETLHARDKQGRAPAHDAAETGQDSVLRVLYLLAPATLLCRDTAGWLPVDVAEAFGRESTVALLSALPPVKVEEAEEEEEEAEEEVEEEPVKEEVPRPKTPEPVLEILPEVKEEPVLEKPEAKPVKEEVVKGKEETEEKKETKEEKKEEKKEEMKEEVKVAKVPKKPPPPKTPKPLAYEIHVTIKSATGLRNADFSHGDSDPYCILEVPGSDKGFRTEVVEDSSSPVWNVSNKLMVTPQETLQFVVWDRDKLDSDDLLGKVSLPVCKFTAEGKFEESLQLEEARKDAYLAVAVFVLRSIYDPKELTKKQGKKPPPPLPPKALEIELTVISAKGLRNADWTVKGGGGSDPYVVVSVLGTDKGFKTAVVQDTSNPEWNMTQKLTVLPKDSVLFTLLDEDKGRKHDNLGKATLTLKEVLPDGFSGPLKLESAGKGINAELLVAVKVLRTLFRSDMKAQPKQESDGAPAYAMQVTVFSAKGLRNADWSLSGVGGSDAFCKVEVPDTGKGFQTEVFEDSSNPVWNKTERLNLLAKETLVLTVLDRDQGDKVDLLGKVSMPMSKLVNGFEGPLKLQEAGKNIEAYLHVSIQVLKPLYGTEVAAATSPPNVVKRPPPPTPPKALEIELTVISAKGLRNADWTVKGGGGSDPYVVVSVLGTDKGFKTAVVQDTSNPEWNMRQNLTVLPKDTVLFTLLDEDKGRKHDNLGKATLTLKEVLPDGFSGPLKLESAGKGINAELLVAVKVLRTLFRSDMKAQPKQESDGAPAYAMQVTVFSAKGLRNADWSLSGVGGSDAFCKVEVPDTGKGFQTEVFEDSSNPVWNKTERLNLLAKETLVLTVLDRDQGDKVDLLGKVSMPMSKLVNGFEGPLKLQEAGKNIEAYLHVSIQVLKPLYGTEVAAATSPPNVVKRPPPPTPPKALEIELTVISAKGLRNADWTVKGGGGSDPYVVVSVLGTDKGFKTAVVQDTSNPEWNMTQKLTVLPKDTVLFTLLDEDQGRKHDNLGKATLTLKEVLPDGFSGPLKLESAGKGINAELLVAVKVLKALFRSDMKAASAPKAAPKVAAKAKAEASGSEKAKVKLPRSVKVAVTVHSAKGLRDGDWSFGKGGSDAFCVVEIPGTKKSFQTHVIRDNNPVWNVTEEMLMAPKESLSFTVFDKDKVGKDLLGKVALPMAEISHGFSGQLKLEESGKSDASLTVTIKLLKDGS
ncbi:unnamed protein product [Effrenium voratum]|nr:unnamed protein product [Effrenium voratum]